MRKVALWSLVCYPLALVWEILAGVLMAHGHEWSAVGLAYLGIYMLLIQAIVAHFALNPKMPHPGDWGFMSLCLLGLGFDLAVIFGGYGELTSYRLMAGALVSPLLAYPVSNGLEKLFPRPQSGEEASPTQ